MNAMSLKEFKSRLKDFEQRLRQREKEHQAYLDEGAGNLDDLGMAREKFESILRDMPKGHENHEWDEKKDTLNRDLASLIILFSQ